MKTQTWRELLQALCDLPVSELDKEANVLVDFHADGSEKTLHVELPLQLVHARGHFASSGDKTLTPYQRTKILTGPSLNVYKLTDHIRTAPAFGLHRPKATTFGDRP